MKTVEVKTRIMRKTILIGIVILPFLLVGTYFLGLWDGYHSGYSNATDVCRTISNLEHTSVNGRLVTMDAQEIGWIIVIENPETRKIKCSSLTLGSVKRGLKMEGRGWAFIRVYSNGLCDIQNPIDLGY